MITELRQFVKTFILLAFNYICFSIQCSKHCGIGVKTRVVVCIKSDVSRHEVTSEEECRDKRKPHVTKPCRQRECGPMWYFDDWSEVGVVVSTML